MPARVFDIQTAVGCVLLLLSPISRKAYVYTRIRIYVYIEGRKISSEKFQARVRGDIYIYIIRHTHGLWWRLYTGASGNKLDLARSRKKRADI